MDTIEDKLKERIKELTCLYEITSIIVNCDYDHPEISLDAIVHCLKRAWLFEKDTRVVIRTKEYALGDLLEDEELVAIRSVIKVFNQDEGWIEVGYPASRYSVTDFLEEEHKLLENVGLEVGNLLERKRIRESELAIKRQMERADRLNIMGEITAGIAHELNTPLTNILGFAELLESRMTDHDEIDDLNKIKENAIFCREVVKKLMFFTCEVPQVRKNVLLKPVVENVLKLLKPTFQNRRLTPVVVFGGEDIAVKVDEIQMTQVLFNLIMNAVYYSPVNGEINIRAGENRNNVVLEIGDGGKGIPGTVGDKVFEPFFTTKPTGEGTGLGLSVVHGIITGHGGQIRHRAGKGGGTVFEIKLPKKQ